MKEIHNVKIVRSELVQYMLEQGHRYVLCEVADNDSDFDWMDSPDIAVITRCRQTYLGHTIFIAVDGSVYFAAQPIDSLGCIMDVIELTGE